MKLNLTNPGHIKIGLLSEGVSFDQNTLKGIGSLYMEKTYHFGNSDIGLSGKVGLPPVLLIPPTKDVEETAVGVHYRADSPWKVKIGKDAQKFLFYKKEKCTQIDYLKRPQFYGKKLENGKNCEDIFDFFTKYALGIFIYGGCLFWEKGMPCKFCSLGKTRKTVGKKAVKVITPELAEEAMKLVIKHSKDEVRYLNYCSGTRSDPNTGYKELLKILRIIKKISPKKFVQHLVFHPPIEFEWYDQMKEAGLDTVTVCKEIINRELFNQICPGKSQIYSHEKYFEALNYAVKIFGKGNVYCTLVAGLEPLDEMFDKLEELAEKGIVPSLNIFHPDKGSALRNEKTPTIEYLLDMAHRVNDIFTKHNFMPEIGGFVRNSIDGEVYRGYFD
ncbi:hypothetical protein GF362_00025 [Candidatus Dojkabacteria bacterium]|nr:hypothetical protein [Candidatus Dojkabacteria bacterium]